MISIPLRVSATPRHNQVNLFCSRFARYLRKKTKCCCATRKTKTNTNNIYMYGKSIYEGDGVVKIPVNYFSYPVAATNRILRKAFKEEIPNTTKIIIAQRISSVMEADKIIILDAGEIVAMGTHEELMATSEIYRETYESQMEGGLSDE